MGLSYKLIQDGKLSNRLFYLSIPPNIFVDVVRCASGSASSKNGWTRVIVEKPFGRDSESSAELTKNLKQYLAEDQIFRYVFSTCLLENGPISLTSQMGESKKLSKNEMVKQVESCLKCVFNA